MKVKDILTEARKYRDIEDEMGTGMSRAEKFLHAREQSKKNMVRASEPVKELTDEIYNMAVQAYTDVRVYRNYLITGATVKVDNVRQQDRNSREVQDMNAKLKSEYGIEPRNVYPASVIYRIPYDMFDQDQRDNETT